MSIKSYWNEEWKDMVIENLPEQRKYKISNYGRIISYYLDNIDGNLLKLGSIKGYKVFKLKGKDGKLISKCVHKIVAEHFMDKPEKGSTLVMHLDYNKSNNYVSNLKWGTETDRRKHWDKLNPNWFRLKPNEKPRYAKLTEATVKRLKLKLNNPKRKTRMKILARQFGVSEMQLYRIKRGENWAHVKVD